MDFHELITQDESEYLDFKAKFHSNKMEFLHDILCLVNAYSENDRYLIFGIKDDKTICGIENDSNKKNNADIQDFLRQSSLNKIPTTKLNFIQTSCKHEIAIIIINNRPDKPFFLTKDKSYRGITVRAGVIYTRLGDTNTPLKESALEEHIELMWRERFGLGDSPLNRFYKLLDDKENWIKMDSDNYLYHKYFPEFTIQRGKDIIHDFREAWSLKFPDPSAASYYVEVKYLSTILEKVVFVSCDGSRYQVPLPKPNGKKKWIIDSKSLEYKIAKLFWQYFPLPDMLPVKGVEII